MSRPARRASRRWLACPRPVGQLDGPALRARQVRCAPYGELDEAECDRSWIERCAGRAGSRKGDGRGRRAGPGGVSRRDDRGGLSSADGLGSGRGGAGPLAGRPLGDGRARWPRSTAGLVVLALAIVGLTRLRNRGAAEQRATTRALWTATAVNAASSLLRRGPEVHGEATPKAESSGSHRSALLIGGGLALILLGFLFPSARA